MTTHIMVLARKSCRRDLFGYTFLFGQGKVLPVEMGMGAAEIVS